MKKSMIAKSMIAAGPGKTAPGEGWLNLDQIASVEVTSEDPHFPVESVFLANSERGWRAADPGPQVLRLMFNQPQSIQRIHLEFSETATARRQEFTLRWAAASESSFHEIVRQQWNFSPTGSTSELEDYNLSLHNVSILELTLTPDVSGGDALATLTQWLVA